MLSNIFADKIINDTQEVNAVKASHSYPLIKELSHKFGWRVNFIGTNSMSIETGRQTFNLVDKYHMPVATVYVIGDWNYSTSSIENQKYVVESRYMDVRNGEISSAKLPYVMRNLKKKCRAAYESQDYVYLREASSALDCLKNGLQSSVGNINVYIHRLGLDTDDIYKLLDSHFNGSLLHDVSKYKEALDLLKTTKQNNDELFQKKKDYLQNPFHIVHAVRDAGVYLTKVVMDGEKLKVLEYPKYYETLSELESEFPLLTMMKVAQEDRPAPRYNSGIPQEDRFYEGLDVCTYYNLNQGMVVSFLVLPCQEI